VLDNLAIHVEHVKRAVRAIGKLHRPKPCVARREEFDFFFIGGTLRFESNAIRYQNFAMNEITTRVANEGIVQKFLREGVAAVNHRASRAREIA